MSGLEPQGALYAKWGDERAQSCRATFTLNKENLLNGIALSKMACV